MSDSEHSGDSESNGISLQDLYDQQQDILRELRDIKKLLKKDGNASKTSKSKESKKEEDAPAPAPEGYMRFNMAIPKSAKGTVNIADVLANARNY